MWGQAIILLLLCPYVRIIPTRVGTSHSRFLSLQLRKDHPHACGDKLIVFVQGHDFVGSSPRVWGQVMPSITFPVKDGIIPTRMGTRERQRVHLAADRDHPHAYGDKPPLIRQIWKKLGSSPRVWGQDQLWSVDNGRKRIIPTRMGTSIFSFAYIHIA